MNKPVICLIHYGELQDRVGGNQDTGYRSGHWVLAVGYDAEHAIIHDSNYWGARREDGAFRYIPNAGFEAALAKVAPGCTRGWQGLVLQ